jgi:hypothetical protein
MRRPLLAVGCTHGLDTKSLGLSVSGAGSGDDSTSRTSTRWLAACQETRSDDWLRCRVFDAGKALWFEQK